MSLTEKIPSFPRRPGVYLFRDASGAVLYVGKAKSLRDRVKSYFVAGRDDRPQIRFLLRRTADIDFIVTDTEKEALLLENTLIKEHRPRYNISLRDDKSYVSIRIGEEHGFPGISLTRRIRKDGARYFGPYDSGFAAREAVEAITRYFRVRSCTDTEFANRVRPCLKHDIGRCTAPCVGRVSNENYAAQVAQALMFLEGKSGELLEILKAKMQEASEAQEYEEAARYRDAVSMLSGMLEKQKAVRHGGGDRDAVGVASVGRQTAVCALAVRAGALVGKRVHLMADAAGDESELVEEFLLARYREGTDIPPVLLVGARLEGTSAVASLLSERRGGKVEVKRPMRGEMRNLVELAATNAREALLLRKKLPELSDTLENLGRRLGLRGAPDLIECVDISNLSGREAVGSVVVFAGGEPDKSRYRIYNIRTLDTPDDYGMMTEVLSRRYSAEGGAGARARARQDRTLPDLLLVDGGKGQLAVARKVVEEMGLPIPVAAIAKGEKKGRADQIFVPGRKNPLKLKRGSKELLLLMRVRDEAHRFGIGAHRRRRIRKTLGR